MNDGDLAHVILTRFNLATPGRESDIRNQPGWLDHRFNLFEKFCLPSVAAQTSRDFDWLIFFDKDTPRLYRDRVERCREMFPFVSVYTGMFKMEGWAQAVRTHVRPRAWLLTTRLDNDDALAIDFCERLRRSVDHPRTYALNFRNGFVLANCKAYCHQHPSNAFASYLEPFDDNARTIWSMGHMELANDAEVVQIGRPGAWLQIIHGRNVSNKIRGYRIPPNTMRALFPPAVLRDVRDHWIGRYLENIFLAPIRWLRDLTIAIIKMVRR